MENFIIATDNCADLFDGYYEQNPTPRLNFPYIMDGKEYVRDEEYPIMEFYEALKEGHLIKSSQARQFDATEMFEEILGGGKDLLYICFSSGMSGNYDNLSYVVKGLKIKYPERRIEIIDTLSGGGGEGLLVYYAKKMQAEGKSMDEIIEWIEANKRNVHHIFIVNDLANLKHSGRISSLAALLGMIVQIKPVLEITREGRVGVLSKALGRKKAVSEMLRFFHQYYEADKNDFILIGHTGRPDEAQVLGEKIAQAAPGMPIKYGLINRLVSGNAGYNSLVVYFLGKLRSCK